MIDINDLALGKCAPISAVSLRPQLAQICGTSVTQIERTYWHLNDEMRLTSALADYKRKSNGTIEVV